MKRILNRILKRYANASYESRGKVKVLFYFQAAILPLIVTHFLVMILILGSDITSRFSLIMMGLIVTVILCLFLLSRGYYTLSTSILLFFVIALLSFNSHNTMLSTRSPARFLTSHFPLLVAIPFSIFFTNKKVFIASIVLILSAVVFNIQSAGGLLQSIEANVSMSVTILTIVLTAVLCLAISSITGNATKLRVQDYEESKSKQLSINEELLRSLINVSGSLDGSSREMKNNSSSFSENIQNQAASMEEMSATIEEITAALDSVNRNIDDQNAAVESLIARLNELFQAARSMQERVSGASDRITAISGLAKSGEQNMGEMSESIRNIGGTSKEMTGIVKIINDISDRINLLSLNAAIEAARAGDAGRGFAVVADEISKLADQTTSSVKEIGAMIQRSEQEIAKGTANTRNTVSTIGEIIAGIGEINEMAGIIAKYLSDHNTANDLVKEETEKVKGCLGEVMLSTREQKRATVEIVKTINNINERTQQNAAGAEKIYSDSENIAQMAGDLKEKIRSFDLTEQ